MSNRITLDLFGYEDLKAKLQSADNQQIHDALTTSAIIVHNDAKMLAPVDTGRLRASITWQVYDDYAEIGTNVDYSPQRYVRAVNRVKSVKAKYLG